MAKKKQVILIERRTIVTNTRFGPFEDSNRAFSHLGQRYRFDLGGLSNWEKTERGLISRKKRLGEDSSQIDYSLEYLASGRRRPIINLDEVIKKYYPYGPDL